MRDLPRQLSADELADLFEGRTALVERLAEQEDPLGPAAETTARSLSDPDKLDALNAHPAIGARRLSPRSAAEQGTEVDPATVADLADLNRRYEERFGFRFVVFVAGRPRSAIVPVLRERLGRSREEELDTGVAELVAIARDRWRNG